MSYRPRVAVLCGVGLIFAYPVVAKDVMYVPDYSVLKKSWRCNDRHLSALEIERTRIPTTDRPNLRISSLKLNGTDVRPSSIDGLESFVASLDEIQTISSRCGAVGETVIVFGFLRGRPNSAASERRQFFVPYARQKK